jgi:hypothetical protein
MLTVAAMMLAAMHGTGDPLAPVRAGKIRCGLPDGEHKTCITMARYEPRGDGGFDVVLDGLSPETGLAIHYRVPLVVKDGGLCITLTAGDIARASFSKAGTVLKGAALAAVRERERAALLPLLGHQVCARDEGPDGVFVAEGYVDGERNPDFDKPVIWVDAADGYTLGPMPGDPV